MTHSESECPRETVRRLARDWAMDYVWPKREAKRGGARNCDSCGADMSQDLNPGPLGIDTVP
jgi:hypothetical protein